MYSPKIREDLISILYWLAKDKKIPMTALVNGIIAKSIEGEPLVIKMNSSSTMEKESK